MKFRKLGTTDIDVSVICLGTMTFGEQNSKKEGFEQMDFALEKGVNFFDTAELYPIMPRKETYADTERIIGDWFKEKNNRDKIILASKIASQSDDLDWIREGGRKLGFDKKNINLAINESLKRLKTDYIDLYQLHWPEREIAMFGKLNYEHNHNENYWTAFEEVLENLNDLVKQGKIRFIGVSNETPWGMMKFIKLAEEKNLPRVMSIQNVYNLVNRVFDIANSEVSIRENCGLLAYSPLAGGRLSGKYLNNKKPDKARYTLWPKRFSRHHTKRGEIAIEKYFNLANKYNIAPSTFANAFVNDRPFVTSNIIGATTIAQLKEDIDSINITLSKEIINEIEEIHLADPNPCV
ncbi:MAG: General stress protein 69 [Alphaproteobacteria bacterium MarineAlpha5_Bin8]|nr:MAG: General stress protein 69 [Alphaproteobacteria bacterium MarineAlpha5_Bin7]PPR46988.1 MAG: General stress protein 69 [Alphaproteobacteria bacterium MarineAlpha5_Bin8]PPR54926.1 MAG: General stress protein 69 [Alphaproteobacteria bacterium MarineAlpha5_Bin6]|tara:strand:+ start:3657 stop:4709 length:1053 start_codon:yes stop_codon:yes gene_type:complete